MLKRHLPVQIETNWTIHICIYPSTRIRTVCEVSCYIMDSLVVLLILLLNSYQKFVQSRSQIFASWTQDTTSYLNPSIWWLEMMTCLSLLYGSWWDMMIFYFLWTGMKHFFTISNELCNVYLSQFFRPFLHIEIILLYKNEMIRILPLVARSFTKW